MVNTAYFLKKERVDRALSLPKGAKLLKMHPNALSRLESGKHFPKYTVYTHVQRGYGFAYHDFFKEYDAEPTQEEKDIVNKGAQKLGAEARWKKRKKKKIPPGTKKKKRRNGLKDDFMGF